MKKRRQKGRIAGSVLAILLVLSMCVSPLSSATVAASEPDAASGTVQDNEDEVTVQKQETGDNSGETGNPDDQNGSGEAEDPDKINNSGDEADQSGANGAGEEEKTANTAENAVLTESTPAAQDAENADTAASEGICDRGVEQVYGDETLKDKDALVLLIFGDGFTADEQDTFYEEAKNTADYVMSVSPWDEYADSVKIYALGTISNESGAKGDSATTAAAANADERDTYFGTYFWATGMQRLTGAPDWGLQKMEDLSKEYVPYSDYSVVIINSGEYGGCGGDYCMASLNSSALDMMVHELGHTVGDLLDEYWADGYASEKAANMAKYESFDNNDPSNPKNPIKWARYLGMKGVGIYTYTDGGAEGEKWCHPGKHCKMQYLSADFCEVCKDALRDKFSENSNVTKMFFQPYADEFIEGTAVDMSQYFILRRSTNKTTADQLDQSKLTLTYYDAEGNQLGEQPTTAGTYTVKAEYSGDSVYDSCKQEGSYTIEKLPVKLSVDSKTYDGDPSEVEYKVTFEGTEYAESDCSIEISYTGALPEWYSDYSGKYYDSTEAPVQPGEYTATLTVKDKDGNTIATKSADFDINFKKTEITNHNDTANYMGAIEYYNNKPVVIVGEGFTVDEQGKFDELAETLINDYILKNDLFKETQLYFNFTTINVISEDSGVSRSDTMKDTYFRTVLDDNGKINVTSQYKYDEDGNAVLYGWYSPYYAYLIAYEEVSQYFAATIVITNDDVKEGSHNEGRNSYDRVIFTGTDDASMEYAAYELLNYYTGDDTGYRAETEDEKELQRTKLLSELYYEVSDEDTKEVLCSLPIITSQAYDEEIIETGEPIDMASYFHTYADGVEVTSIADAKGNVYDWPEDAYTMHYYNVKKDGTPDLDNELSVAPSEPGTYYARAELIGKTIIYTSAADGKTCAYPAGSARGETVYTIVPQKDAGERIIKKELTESEVPETLEEKYETPEDIQDELTRLSVDEIGCDESDINTEFYDVKLQFYDSENDAWIDATEENFPEDGITVTFPYPEGSDKNDYFVITHMFTVDSKELGTTAGDTEQFTSKDGIILGRNGLTVTLNGLSPVSIAWKETEEPEKEEPGTEEPGTEEPGSEDPGSEDPSTGEPGNTSEDNKGAQGSDTDLTKTNATSKDNGSVSASNGTAKTGDSAPIVLYLVLAGACVVIAAVVLVRRRRNA